tara:strand:- start:13 stop:306 length:294 start_codon:yes stop_codon:yes gene_type:complete
MLLVKVVFKQLLAMKVTKNVEVPVEIFHAMILMNVQQIHVELAVLVHKRRMALRQQLIRTFVYATLVMLVVENRMHAVMSMNVLPLIAVLVVLALHL